MKIFDTLLILVFIISLSSCNAQNKMEFENLGNKIPKELKIDTIEQINFENDKEIETIITASDSSGSFKHEFWFKFDSLVHTVKYPWFSINYKWFIDLDGDGRMKIIRAQGEEDGIDYVIYGIKDDEETSLLYFYPTLKDDRFPDQTFWGYPWDIYYTPDN